MTEFQVLYVGLEMQLGQREQEIHMKDQKCDGILGNSVVPMESGCNSSCSSEALILAVLTGRV